MSSNPGSPTPPLVVPQHMNSLAMGSFILSLLGFGIISIILGAIGLSQIKRTGQSGRGFALAAVWIGSVSAAFVSLFLAGAIWITIFPGLD